MGTAIFRNDTSMDVRGEFRDLIGAGETAETVSAKILGGSIPGAEVEIDPDDNAIWLGLAATQHKTGHIIPEVIERALRIIESQDELERWEFPDRRRRATALAKLREALLKPAPPPAVIKPRRLRSTDLLQGQHQVLTDPESGAQLLLRVHTFSEDDGGRYVHYVVLACYIPQPVDDSRGPLVIASLHPVGHKLDAQTQLSFCQRDLPACAVVAETVGGDIVPRL